MARKIGKPVPVEGGGNLMIDMAEHGDLEVRVVKIGTIINGQELRRGQILLADGFCYLTRKSLDRIIGAQAEQQRRQLN